ncbi:MAG: HNH endonuclease [Candidatus Aenigmarchaeota archaeon CG_4_10_14_0_8_um_filter_37_24]|nr:HNH endonuclease [Candidatus Aenigmarchaeota archaeon]OIN85139.1 MAG: hypothetical protein AUJ50_05555 [Candidatus Aenigmarchaeota archaeon CG1_02_38_14]PIV68751.1 MAG: HNH endonuclease [Candidatus Aenigmarchaeota archaeon CG01_land_8_20_14_3_00_37_9]PIW41021.1 MAG: HNH endonuclease [Candidatus Aenigmarchaeota archaeon CG15_BIG_FIL_POST_REV_8_21_14_020_37_27]PIX50343.1 MAG: HNH endonuclease [Candidatus Aenigmarchaeota archaeon CG_4_8_14_3_um_filter_37_24]PIY35227.1 MAG: HNH endonuclease [Ca
MKLYVELVPKTCWYENLRKVLPKKEWDKIRKDAYSKAGHKCEICGVSGRLNCHEIWEYDDENNIQSLKGFQALCDDCHMIKHIGFVNIQISKGVWLETKLVDLAKHFIRVNNVGSDEFKKHVDNAFDVWEKRSRKKWKTNLGEYGKKPSKFIQKKLNF